MPEGFVTDREALKSTYGEPSAIAARKTLPKLDKHCRAFIAASPFLVLGTASAEGPADVSPRGDPPGFVAVLDDETLLIPDRPGNRRVDSMSNILENPHVALIFFVPGMKETLRVNGTARITDDQALLEPLSVNGKRPVTGILVSVREAFLHCAKALQRSRLWDPESRIDRQSFPSLGRMITDQIDGLDLAETEAQIQDSLENRLY